MSDSSFERPREQPGRDPLQFYNVIIVILGWTAVVALSAYALLS